MTANRLAVATAVVPAAVPAVAATAPIVPVALKVAPIVGGTIYYNPETWDAVSDFIGGLTPGPFSATWAGVAGEAISDWSDIKRTFDGP